MKKLFISQPMNGKTEEQILFERQNAINKVKDFLVDDIEIIESYFSDYEPINGCIPLKYLSKSLELLADADIVYFVEGWSDARGCKIEHECAVEYGIDLLYGGM